MELDSGISIPLYKQLEDMLLNEIENGTRPPGSKIPTENELSSQYHVSRVTVRKALASLSDLGYLNRRSGKGTFVAEKKLQRDISSAAISFTEMCKLMNVKPGAKVTRISREEPTETDKELMNIPEEEEVIVIERIRYADGIPVIIECNRYPESFSFLFEENLNDSSMYEILRTRHNIILDHSSKTIDIVFATAKEAKALNIPKNYPLLRINSVVHDSTSKIRNICRQLCVGDKIKLII